MRPAVIQEGRGVERALVYLLHVGDAKPDRRYPKGTFDAIREACGPDARIVVRGDDGTMNNLPIADVFRGPPDDFAIARIVVGGWSAGVRGIRRFLIEANIDPPRVPHLKAQRELLAGIVAADGLHAPWAERRSALTQTLEEADAGSGAPFKLPLGPSEVFRPYVERARRGEFAFVLTHCMQTYMEAKNVSPRYLSTSTVARELTGWPCAPPNHLVELGNDVGIQSEGRLEVHSYAGPKVDFAGHVWQLREALPAGLARMREWGLL